MTDGAFPDRLSQLRARWEADPSSRIFLQLAEEYRHLGRVQEALAVLDKGLREHPGYLSALVAKGRCHLELGESEAARAVLERVVKQDATQMVANKLLVRAYLETGDPARARERLDLYSLLNDSDPEIEELRRRIRTMERRDEAAPPGPTDDPFALDAPAPIPRRAEADIFDLGAGSPPSRGGDVFELDPAAPPASAASLAPEPEAEAEEAGADGDLFPGLASRESRSRYLEGLAAEGLFAFGPPGPAPASPFPPPLIEPVAEPEMEAVPEPAAEDTSWLDEGATPYAPVPMEPDETPVFAEAAPPAPAAEDLWSEEAASPWQPDRPPQDARLETAGIAEIAEMAESAEARAWTGEAPAVEPAPAFAPAARPAAPAATATLGDLYLRQGHLAEAERIFREVLQREPDNAAAHAGLERLLDLQERREREARPLDARQLLAGFRPGPGDTGEAGARARKIHLLSRYLQRLRQGGPRDVS